MMQKEMDLYVRITDALFDLRDSLPGLAPEEKAELLMVALFEVADSVGGEELDSLIGDVRDAVDRY